MLFHFTLPAPPRIFSSFYLFFLSYLTSFSFFFFFFNDTATTEIYTLSLHDALPIYMTRPKKSCAMGSLLRSAAILGASFRSEEHTSELQSRRDLVCRLLLEKKKKKKKKKKNKKKKTNKRKKKKHQRQKKRQDKVKEE